MATQVTNGIRVSVETMYQQEHSDPVSSHYVFAYRITITNNGDETICLRRRQWLITDSLGKKREVEGEGVVGEQPVLLPGKSYQYVSGCNFNTDIGKMSGAYKMERMNDHTFFDVKIPDFVMSVPFRLN